MFAAPVRQLQQRRERVKVHAVGMLEAAQPKRLSALFSGELKRMRLVGPTRRAPSMARVDGSHALFFLFFSINPYCNKRTYRLRLRSRKSLAAGFEITERPQL